MGPGRDVKSSPTSGSKFFVGLLFFLGIAMFGGSIWYNIQHPPGEEEKEEVDLSEKDRDIVETFSPSVVFIETSKGSGSGFIVTSDGYILTNAHVTGEDEEVTVRLYDGLVYDANVEAVDPSLDLAIVKILETGLPEAILGDSDDVLPGTEIIVIGYPLASVLGDEPYVSQGIISAIREEENRIDTDAAVNPGNSGGPMISKGGNRVVGIIYQRFTGAEGIGSAIPINVAKDFFSDSIGLVL